MATAAAEAGIDALAFNAKPPFPNELRPVGAGEPEIANSIEHLFDMCGPGLSPPYH